MRERERDGLCIISNVSTSVQLKCFCLLQSEIKISDVRQNFKARNNIYIIFNACTYPYTL